MDNYNNSSKPNKGTNPIVSKGFIIFVIIALLIDGVVLLLTMRNSAEETVGEFSNDTVAVEGINESIQEDETVNEDMTSKEETTTVARWKKYMLTGNLTDDKGKYPIELTFVVDEQANEISNAIYTNVNLGGKIRMSGEMSGDNFIFTGKDGRNKFRMTFDKYSYRGVATDGPKKLELIFNSTGIFGLDSPPKDDNTDMQLSTENVKEENIETEETSIPDQQAIVSDDNLYAVSDVNVAPQFLNGGHAGLMQYIAQNIQYPNSGGNIQGRVVVRFVIEKNGSVSDLQVEKSLNEAFDKEACRVVETTNGKWQPAQKNGNAVRTTYTLPITFRAN